MKILALETSAKAVSAAVSENGKMLADTTTPDGCQVNGIGAWVQDGIVQTRNGGGSQSYGPGGSGDSGSYGDEDDQDSYSYGYDDDFYSWLFGYEYDPEWYLHDETLSEGDKAYYHYEANYYNWDGKSMETYDKLNEQYNRIAANPSAETAAQDAPSAWRGVVATGGGMVLAEENRRFMRETGRVFFLDVPVAELVRRLSRNPLEAQRPSLTGKSLTEEVADVLAQRLPLYEEAHHRLDAARPLRDVRAQALALLSGNAGA